MLGRTMTINTGEPGNRVSVNNDGDVFSDWRRPGDRIRFQLVQFTGSDSFHPGPNSFNEGRFGEAHTHVEHAKLDATNSNVPYTLAHYGVPGLDLAWTTQA